MSIMQQQAMHNHANHVVHVNHALPWRACEAPIETHYS